MQSTWPRRLPLPTRGQKEKRGMWLVCSSQRARWRARRGSCRPSRRSRTSSRPGQGTITCSHWRPPTHIRTGFPQSCLLDFLWERLRNSLRYFHYELQCTVREMEGGIYEKMSTYLGTLARFKQLKCFKMLCKSSLTRTELLTCSALQNSYNNIKQQAERITRSDIFSTNTINLKTGLNIYFVCHHNRSQHPQSHCWSRS